MPVGTESGRHGSRRMPQLSFLYQYLVGGLVFLIGLLLVLRSGALDTARGGSARRYLWILVIGFFVFAAVHAVSVFILPGT